jgi:hypothetical protein
MESQEVRQLFKTAAYELREEGKPELAGEALETSQRHIPPSEEEWLKFKEKHRPAK